MLNTGLQMDSSANSSFSINLESGNEEDREANDTPLSSNRTVKSTTTCQKRKHSGVWDHFTKYTDETTRKLRARCIHCGIATYAIGDGSNSHGTKNLNIDIHSVCPALNSGKIGQMFLSHDAGLLSKKISQEVYGENMAAAIIKHILNLVVQAGLKVAHDALHKIRESIKNVKESEGRKMKFVLSCKKEKVTSRSSLRFNVY